MSEYKIAFDKDSNVWKLYQALKKAGVKDSDLDRGYYETDYINKKRSFIGKDKVVQTEEVLDYALENYERFHLAISENMGYVIPWSLDDFDPNTTFDQEIRDKIKAKITFFREELKKAGFLDPASDKYKELLAVSVFTYVITGKKGPAGLRAPEEAINELKKAKLTRIADQIMKEGGLGTADFKGDCNPEATALEALKKKCGMCTEFSYLMFAALKMAGLEALSLYAEAPKAYLEKKGWPPDSTHNSLLLALKNKKRIIDPALGNADAEAHYKENSFKWVQESRREWLGFYYVLYAQHFMQDKENNINNAAFVFYKKARELNSNYYTINMNLGGMHIKFGELEAAAECFKKALALKPQSVDAMKILASVYTKKKQYNQAIELYKKVLIIDPKNVEAIGNIASIYMDQAINLFNHGRNLMIEHRDKEAYAKFDQAKAVLQEYLKYKKDDEQALKIMQQIESVQKQLKARTPE